MNKKILIVAGGLLLIVLAAGFVFGNDLIALIKPEKKSVSLKTTKPENPSEEAVNLDLVTWKDEAGFSFQYPKGTEINTHPEDQVNYANLELTYPDKKGKIIILCRDSLYQNLDDWLKKDETVKLGSSLNTKIASQSAKRIALGENREMSGFIDGDSVLYTIDKQSAGEVFWDQAYTAIVMSFKLTPLAGESEKDFNSWLGGFDTESVDAVEPVEVIE